MESLERGVREELIACLSPTAKQARSLASPIRIVSLHIISDNIHCIGCSYILTILFGRKVRAAEHRREALLVAGHERHPNTHSIIQGGKSTKNTSLDLESWSTVVIDNQINKLFARKMSVTPTMIGY